MRDDRKLDPLAGLLARELKGATPVSAGVCPGPDVLAAYFERSLASAEMAGCESHFAACARCQEQLATLARMETAVAPQRVAESAGGFSWFLHWRWLTPVLAGAGALAIWVALRPATDPLEREARYRSTAPLRANEAAKAPAESKDLSSADPAKDAVTRLERDAALPGRTGQAGQAQSAPAGPRRTDAFSSRAASAGAAAPPAVAGGTLGESAEGQASRALSSEYKLADKDAAAKPAERADRAELSAAVREGQRVGALERAPAGAPVMQDQAQVLPKKNEPVAASTVTVETAAETEARRKQQAEQERAAGQVPQTPQQTAAALAKADAAAGPDIAQRQRPQAAPSSAQPQEQARPVPQQVGAFRGTEKAPMAQAQDTRDATALRESGFYTTQSPSRRAVWRVGPQGRIEHYQLPKKILELQNSGVTADLLSGSAPSEKVCWVVGRAGTILLTTDAGKTWQRLGSPSDADVIAVVATDETRAAITIAGGKRYVTTDAGRSWKSPN
jgi:hypothetical protein